MDEMRKTQILNLLADKKYMSVKELADSIFVSEPTIRRDLTVLEKDGLLKRTRGGASYVSPRVVQWPLVFRNAKNLDKKYYIGKLATEFVSHGDSIFLDSSSTCLCFAQELPPEIELNVLTYGIPAARHLTENTRSHAELVCGTYDAKHDSIFGVKACEYIQHYHAKTCFLSACGLNCEGQLTEYHQEDLSMKQAFCKQAEQTIVLIDSSKISKTFFRQVLSLKDIDIIITDQPLPKELDDLCYQYNTQVIFE